MNAQAKNSQNSDNGSKAVVILVAGLLTVATVIATIAYNLNGTL